MRRWQELAPSYGAQSPEPRQGSRINWSPPTARMSVTQNLARLRSSEYAPHWFVDGDDGHSACVWMNNECYEPEAGIRRTKRQILPEYGDWQFWLGPWHCTFARNNWPFPSAAPSLVRIQPKVWPPLPPLPKLILFGPSLSLVPSQARVWPPLPVSAEINPVWTAAPVSAGGTSQCSPAL